MPSTADHLAEQIVDGDPNMQKIELTPSRLLAEPHEQKVSESMFEQVVVLIRFQAGPGIWNDPRTVCFP